MHFRNEQVASTHVLTVRCRLFARYAEIAGVAEVTLELPRPATVSDAITFLRARIPHGHLLPEHPLTAVNAVHALPGEELHEGDELALLPPMAGGGPGMTRLTHSGIDLPGVLAEVSGATLGGTAVFLGSVREGPDDGPVTAIEYSAYEEMAEAEIERIMGEGTTRWQGCRLAVRHRLGRVPTGEASVVVAASAPHRAEAFDACRYVIEEIKRRVPIWKKEIHADGSAGWRENDGTRGPAAVA